ncbi:MAG: DUF5667 domain-containing protein [Patescibacteria group bacterium]|nr:DUF5667 domain-containing protein [Patescibacteria group bacterium]
MSEQELIKQLNNLKSIKPDSQWQNRNREVLLNQISQGEEAVKVGWLALLRSLSGFRMLKNILPQQLAKQLSQPIAAVFLIIVFIVFSGAVSLSASHNTKPGDSLYIAKIISEKTQQAITFNDKEKVKLGVEFAGNRAREITQVLAEADDQKEETNIKVEKLAQDFKKEIKQVKTRLTKVFIPTVTLKNTINQEQKDKNSENKKSDSQIKKEDESSKAEDGEVSVFSANSGKSDQGMQLSEPSGSESSVASDEVETSADDTANENSTGIEKVLSEAEELFDNKDYDGAINKLEQANNIMDETSETGLPAEEGEVKGESVASTTDSNLDQGQVLGVDEKAGGDAETASSTKE